MLLHAKHASMSYESVIVKSPDTDVFALLVSIGNDIPCHLYFDTGTQSNRRILDIDEISSQLGIDVCRALPGFHAFSGMLVLTYFKLKLFVFSYKRTSKKICHEFLIC